jgi:uncharacterized membrane protein
MVDTALIRVSGQAHLDAGNTSETMLTFDQKDVADGTIKRSATSAILQSAITSLLGELRLDVQIIGLNLGLPGEITAAVGDSLTPVAKPLDELVHALLTTLGLSLGEADFRVHDLLLRKPALAHPSVSSMGGVASVRADTLTS